MSRLGSNLLRLAGLLFSGAGLGVLGVLLWVAWQWVWLGVEPGDPGSGVARLVVGLAIGGLLVGVVGVACIAWSERREGT